MGDFEIITYLKHQNMAVSVQNLAFRFKYTTGGMTSLLKRLMKKYPIEKRYSKHGNHRKYLYWYNHESVGVFHEDAIKVLKQIANNNPFYKECPRCNEVNLFEYRVKDKEVIRLWYCCMLEEKV
jgi:phage FluMu protein Com